MEPSELELTILALMNAFDVGQLAGLGSAIHLGRMTLTRLGYHYDAVVGQWSKHHSTGGLTTMARIKSVTVNTTTDEVTKKVTGEVTIVAEFESKPSKSGKMDLITCSNGNQLTPSTYEGKEVYANVNIGTFTKPKAK